MMMMMMMMMIIIIIIIKDDDDDDVEDFVVQRSRCNGLPPTPKVHVSVLMFVYELL